MASMWASETTHCDDEDCIIIDQEDSTSSYDAFYWSESINRSAITECSSEISTNYNASRRSIVSSSYLETPKRKSSSFSQSQPSARRKLVFPVSDDEKDVDNGPSCSLQISKTPNDTNCIIQAKSSKPSENSVLEDSAKQNFDTEDYKNLNQGGEKSAFNQTTLSQYIDAHEGQQKKDIRKIAQLVVWTKNIGKGLNNSEKEIPAPATDIISKIDPAPEVLDNLENNLFYVQCPVRSAASSKKEKIPNKRLKKSPTKNKKKSSRKNRAAAQAGSSAGRAYRAYLHSCLEKQRQQLITGDFKVEKLFQPDQGVALPGEVIPPIEISSCMPPELSANPVPIVDTSSKSINPLSSSSELDAPTLQNVSKPTGVDNLTTINNCEGEFAVFDLPDRFTVTTDTANAFDLLIQNVVHEEMIDGEDDDELMGYKFDRVRKKMRMSTGSTSSEERMSMDETGKPRCTYTELIEKALTESGGLTVSEIYTWISDRYPFYKPDDDRWKNSVRHNLSINPYFKKGEKARSGAGHLWTISEESKGLRSSLINFDERRRSPSDPSEIIMPMDSETDRAVANILGQYLSECRANKEASEKEKGSRNTVRGESLATLAAPSQPATEAPEISHSSHSQQQQPLCIGDVASCDMAPIEDVTSFNLNELNSGQFTVDLAGITIPDGGSINFEELVNAGRLIYIQTDPDANKENDSSQAVIVNECMLSDLSTLDCSTGTTAQDEGRFNSFYNDSLALELGFEKNDSVPNVSFANEISQLNYSTSAFSTSSSGTCADILTCGQLTHQGDVGGEHHNHDLTVLDQVIPMSYDDVVSVNSESQMTSSTLGVINAAALYESKELGISYTFATGANNHDLL